MEDRLAELIQQAGVGRLQDRLAEQAARSIRMHRQPADRRLEPGASRLGGVPDLPAGVAWPRRDVAETPLAFLAQINLAETASADLEKLLPSSGMLYFFADPEEPWGFKPADRDHWQVIYAEQVPAAGPTEPPEDLAAENIFHASALAFEAEWTLPPYESPMVEALGLTTEETDAYFEASGDGTIHRLLGHPQQIQGFLPYEVAMAEQGLFHSSAWDSEEGRAARERHREWLLLLQIDSDWDHGMLWGDVGRLYFYMRKEDLAARRFDRVWLTMQCG